MGFRFRKSIPAARGIRLDLGKRGVAAAGRRLASGGLGSVLLSLLGAGLFFALISTLLDSTARTSDEMAPAAETGAARDAFYLHGSMNVRTAPSSGAPVVRTLGRGERVELGPKDEAGWARVYSVEGEELGYLYRASELVRSSPPG